MYWYRPRGYVRYVIQELHYIAVFADFTYKLSTECGGTVFCGKHGYEGDCDACVIVTFFLQQSSSSPQPKTVTIRKTYDFAGEEVV